LVLEGVLQVTDIDLETGKELGNRIKVAGDFAHKEPGDVHMEQAGPNGALVLFSIYNTDGEGKLAEALTEGGNIMSTSTIKSILNRR
jgi:quercetin dioxygenase-like cupin family protein